MSTTTRNYNNSSARQSCRTSQRIPDDGRRMLPSFSAALLLIVLWVMPGDIHAVSSPLLTRLKRQTPLNDTVVQISDIVRLLGPRNQVDFVAILDRSQSVGKRLFYSTERGVLEAVLTQYATIHPDYVRTSVVTFSKDSTVVYDQISDWQSSLTKCEVFDSSPSPVFSQVMFTTDPLLLSGTQLQGAFNLTVNILRRGKQLRPNATQVVLVMTDGDYEPSEDPTAPLNIMLNDLQVNIFSMGLGSWLKTGSVRAMTSKPYYYGTIAQWIDLVGSVTSPVQYVPSSVSSNVSPFWAPIPRAACGNGTKTCSSTSSCYCDVDTRVRQCLCEAGNQPATDDVMTTEQSVTFVNISTNCQACPVSTYKESPGNEQCSPCSVGLTTGSSGSTNMSMCSCDNCTDPCDGNTCSAHARCTTSMMSLYGNGSCTCQAGWTDAPSCATNPNNCLTSQAADCLNNAKCYDKPDYVQCICPIGYKGRHCEIQEYQCDFAGICVNNGTCVNMVNAFLCQCPGGWMGDFCQDVDPSYKPSSPSPPTQANPTTPSTTASVTSTLMSLLTTNGTSTIYSGSLTSESNDSTTQGTAKESAADLKLNSTPTMSETLLIIIIVCSVGGAILLVIIIVVIVLSVRHCKRQRSEKDSTASDEKFHQYDTQRSQGGVSSRVGVTGGRFLPKTISNRFSGIWKKSTLRVDGGTGGLWYETASMCSGLPSVPRRRPELDTQIHSIDPAAVEFEEVFLENQQIYQCDTSMDGWKSYIIELEKSGAVECAIIAKLDTLNFAKTSNWIFSRSDISSLEYLMNEKSTGGTVLVDGVLFQIRTNDGITAAGVSECVEPSKVIAIGKTKNYVIAATAAHSSEEDVINCEREVQYITDHISAEGY